MKRFKYGFTLIEVMVVLVIIALAAIMTLPNFTPSLERARSTSAQNNLLAIYTAQQNYINNNNTTVYCNDSVNANQCDSIADINTALSLNIQDDGTYLYQCPTVSTCTATRNLNPVPLTLTLTLNTPINLVSQVGNPGCKSTTGNANWCP